MEYKLHGVFCDLLPDLRINADVVEKKEQIHPGRCGVCKRDTGGLPLKNTTGEAKMKKGYPLPP